MLSVGGNRRIFRNILFLNIFLFSLAGCGGSGDDRGGESVSGTISFVHLNDLHGHLTAHNDLRRVDAAAEPVFRGGLARIATLIDEVRADNPLTLVMNIGDTYHGGVEALFTQGNAIVEPVNALGIDVGVPGNWDFAYGPGVTRARYTDMQDSYTTAVDDIARPNFPNLAANVTLAFPPARAGEPFLPPTLIKTVGGIAVGFIGLTSDIVPRMHTLLAAGLEFVQGESNHATLVEQHARDLRAQGAVVVVVMSELGIHKDFRLAKRISSDLVDVFFSAHTHELTEQPLIADTGVWVVEAGNDTTLGRLDITVKNGLIVDKHWRVLEVTPTIDESPEVQALVAAARAPFLSTDINMTLELSDTELKLDRPIDTQLGKLKFDVHRRQALSNSFNAAFTQLLRDTTGTQLAMTPGFRFDAVIPGAGINYEDPAVIAGSVTIEEAYRFFPVPFTLSTASVSGHVLREAMEANLTAVFSPNIFQHSGGWFDGYDGIALTVDLAEHDSQRVMEMRLADSGELINDADKYSVTGCSRPFDLQGESTLCSYSGFENVTAVINPDTGLAWSGAEFLIHGIENGLLQPPPSPSVTDINDTALWPVQPFYQPLGGVEPGQI